MTAETHAPAPDAASFGGGRRTADKRMLAFSRRYGDALRAGDPAAAEDVVGEAMAKGLTPADVHVSVITPAMHWIGRLWELRAISVADEHLATAISQSVLAMLYPALLRWPPRSRQRVLLAAAQGEQHVLGLRMAGDTLEGQGYDVHFLGADVPVGSLVEIAERSGPAALALSATMQTATPYLLQALDGLSRLPRPPAILLGGGGVPASLRRRADVTWVASSREAPAALERADGVLPWAGPAMPRPRVDALIRGVGLVGGASGAALAAADVARAQSRRAFDLERLALRDPLTGLLNRRAYDDRMADLLERGARAAVVALDIDRFKAVNDTFGHPEADRVLVDVGRVLSCHVRPGDIAARVGGDEFALVLSGTSEAAALEVAERIRAAVAAEIDPAVTVSLGVSAVDGDAREVALAVDRALYDSKRSGRNSVTAA